MSQTAERKNLGALLEAKPVRIIGIDEIMKTIPHRYPFLLVDSVSVVEEKRYGVGIKCVTVNEPFFQGHFPGKPVMPAVLTLEAMAQTCAAMVMSGEGYTDKIAFFTGIDGAKFRRQVLPGHVLKLAVSIERLSPRGGKGLGWAYVDGQLAAEAEMTFLFGDK